MKVFLSHSSRDKALVREIRSHLPDHVKTWLDEEDLLVGQDLKISIHSAIQEDADFVVIFLGKEAVASEWVKRELEWALEREKNIGRVFVLPVLLDDVWDMVEPNEFRNRLYIKCFDQSEDAVRGVAQKLSDHIFSWLSRHLDESKRMDLEKKRNAEATGEALKALSKMTEAFATEVPDHWATELRVLCTSIAGLAPQVQLDRLSPRIARELQKWQEADRRTKESLDKGGVDEPLSKLGLAMTAIANGKMIEMLENCEEELEMWKNHTDQVSPDAVLERIHILLGVKSTE